MGMLNVKMTLIGKVLLFTTGVGFGMAFGFMKGKSMYETNNGNKIELHVDTGSVKKGSNVNINLEADQTKEDQGKKAKKKFLGIF